MGKRKATEDDEVYHFIAYCPFNGKLYELDGIQKGPILHGECTDEDWLEKVKPVIMERINTYAQTEIRFNLLALVNDRGDQAEKSIENLQSEKAAIVTKLVSMGVEVEAEMEAEFTEDVFNALPDAQDELTSRLTSTGE
jgi:ubiquitin carboxyl-terminal hydrolase L5